MLVHPAAAGILCGGAADRRIQPRPIGPTHRLGFAGLHQQRVRACFERKVADHLERHSSDHHIEELALCCRVREMDRSIKMSARFEL